MQKESCLFYSKIHSFWIGLFERLESGKVSVSKVTFGKETKDEEVYDFVLKHYYDLKFSPSVNCTE